MDSLHEGMIPTSRIPSSQERKGSAEERERATCLSKAEQVSQNILQSGQVSRSDPAQSSSDFTLRNNNAYRQRTAKILKNIKEMDSSLGSVNTTSKYELLLYKNKEILLEYNLLLKNIYHPGCPKSLRQEVEPRLILLGGIIEKYFQKCSSVSEPAISFPEKLNTEEDFESFANAIKESIETLEVSVPDEGDEKQLSSTLPRKMEEIPGHDLILSMISNVHKGHNINREVTLIDTADRYIDLLTKMKSLYENQSPKNKAMIDQIDKLVTQITSYIEKSSPSYAFFMKGDISHISKILKSTDTPKSSRKYLTKTLEILDHVKENLNNNLKLDSRIKEFVIKKN